MPDAEVSSGSGRSRAAPDVAVAAERHLHGEPAAQVLVPHPEDRAHAVARELAAQAVRSP
jgi:hypothetical protein